jgi:hypothetical protein
MLEVDNRVILPEITHTRFILTAADVIHSFASLAPPSRVPTLFARSATTQPQLQISVLGSAE